jgi:hypothetical protein
LKWLQTNIWQFPGGFSMSFIPDHGLPLVQLKEQRRELVVALQRHAGPISGWQLLQIATLQQAISAFEDVISDLDAEAETPNMDETEARIVSLRKFA